MKVTPNTKQVLDGTIQPAELAAFLRQTFEIPEGADIRFRVGDGVADGPHEVTDAQPLAFAAEWTGTKQAEQVVSARVVANVKLP
jgi:hypothetical protein